MKNLLAFLLLAWSLSTQAQFNPLTNPLVYQSPEMAKVTVQKGIVYKSLHQDTTLRFDIYYPPGFNKNKSRNLPVVIFHNGVGGNQVPDWRIYQDWARLVAANGMIAINHQSRQGKTKLDLEFLLTYVRGESENLKLDKNNIALWMCSANTPTGWATANDPKNEFIKAAVIYYGVVQPNERLVNRKDLEILIVRAGLDSYNINKGLEELMADAMRKDVPIEFINYPGGQHAFDGVDNTPRSKEIILQTIDFFKRNLLQDNSDVQLGLITNLDIWNMVLTEKKTDEAMAMFKRANETYRNDPKQYVVFNQFINENNLNGLGYTLMGQGRVDDAIKVFAANIEAFPTSPNCYDALGDAYDRKQDIQNTLKYSKLALEKLASATNVNPQFAQAIRESAQAKIDKIENPMIETEPYKRAHHALVYDEANKAVILTAGSTPLNGGQSFRFFNDLWKYNNGAWTKIGNVGDERSGVALAYNTKNGKIYSYGGFTPDNNSHGELRVLEGNEWKVLSNLPEMNAAEGGLVYDADRDKFIAFGGSASRGLSNNITWEWDGQAWKKLDIAGPEGRQAFVMVYDAKRKRTILYGGSGADRKVFDDTWEFDGKTWIKVSDQGPGARISAGYAYDSKRGQLIVFGGIMDGKFQSDTWAYDGKAWKKLADIGPAARVMGYMAYDKSRNKIIMFGGRLGWPNDAGDTWEWDGEKWTEIKK